MGGVWSDNITLWESTVGGFSIGLSALILLHGAGQVLGFSSLIGTFISHPIKGLKCEEFGWKWGFLASFLLTAQLLVNIPGFMAQYGGIFDPTTFVPLWAVAVSGLLAGYGTKMANGCTSGHGISGVGRLSVRSIVAVCTFMGTAFLSASLCSPAFPRINQATRYVSEDSQYFSKVASGFGIAFTALFCFATATNLAYVRKEQRQKQQTKITSDAKIAYENTTINTFKTSAEQSWASALASSDNDIEVQAQVQQGEDSPAEETAVQEETSASSYIIKMAAAMCAAPVFAFGLTFGGMTKQTKIISFFDLTGFARGEYDPSLLFLFAAGCATSFVAYQFVAGYGLSFIQDRLGDNVRTKALSGDKYNVSSNKEITKSLVIGSALFGISMGIGGYCPSPSVLMVIGGHFDATFVWIPLFVAGRVFHTLCFGNN